MLVLILSRFGPSMPPETTSTLLPNVRATPASWIFLKSLAQVMELHILRGQVVEEGGLDVQQLDQVVDFDGLPIQKLLALL